MAEESQERGGPLGWYQRSNKKLLFGVAVVIVAMGTLMGTSLRGSLTYYVTVDELKADGQEAYGDRFRVGGRVQQGTIERDAASNLRFILYHNETDNSIPVQYKGAVPDIFGDEVDVIVEGRWNADGTFYATNLLTQHPPEFRIAEPGKPHEPVEERDY
ncbi:MAG: cytochrome c maturation protein CcmE [Dehalococcoidia bacterium]